MKLPMKEKTGYGIGAFGTEMISTTVASYLMVFMTGVLGIPAGAAGTMFLVAKIWDAINDPIMGTIADRTRTKWGSYRPFILFGCIPQSIFFVLCFAFPGFLQTPTSKLVWAYAIYICYGMANTMINVPTGALNNVMTTDGNERASLATFKNVGASAAGIISGVIAMPLILYFGKGEVNEKGYLGFAIVCAIVSVISYLILFATSRERMQPFAKKTSIKDGFKSFKGSKPGIALMIGFIVCGIAIPFRGMWTAYYCLYYLNLPTLISSLAFVVNLVPLLVSPLLLVVMKRFGKKNALLWCFIAQAISGVIFLIAKANIPLLMIASGVSGLGKAAMTVTFAAVPDVCDYNEYKNNLRTPGFAYTAVMFCFKLGTGLVSYFCGMLLMMVGFVEGQTAQPAGAVHGIYLMNGLVPIVFSVIAILAVALLYNLTNKKTAEIYAELEERRK